MSYMADEGIVKVLEELDLSDKEAKIYLALLELGQSNVTRLSNKAGINRITTYHLLDSLAKKGLVRSIVKDKVQNFIAVEPRALLKLLREKEEKIKGIIPELESRMEKVGKKPSVSLYEGAKGISSLLDDVVNNAGEEILAYGNFSVAEEALEYQSLHYRKTRLSKKVRTKAVVNGLDKAYFIKDPEWKKLTEVRILKNLDKLSTWTFVYGNKVSILTLKKELIGVIIENEEIAEKERFVFDILWSKAKG